MNEEFERKASFWFTRKSKNLEQAFCYGAVFSNIVSYTFTNMKFISDFMAY